MRPAAFARLAGPSRTAMAAARSSRRTAATRAAAPTAAEAMQVAVKEGDAGAWKGDLLVVGAFAEAIDGETYAIKDDAIKAVDATTGSVLAEVMVDNEFKGEPGSAVSVRVPSSNAKTVCVVGLGKEADATPAAYKKLGETAAAEARKGKPASIAVAIAGASSPPSASVADAVATGLHLGAFADERFKDEKKRKPFPASSADLVGFAASADTDAAIARAASLAAGVKLTRELVNAPPNFAAPRHLAEAAAEIAALSDRVTLTVLEKEQCEAFGKCGMGLYLGVAQASDEPPKFIHLKYTNPKAGPDAKKLAVVGKGVTFDAGGLNIKAGAGSMIELMKFDMGGAAATLGAADAIARIAPENPAIAEVHFVVAACENMISGNALHPGDILTAANGVTVEVNNTDAEGRLTLADALLYVQEEGCTEIVDVATLTGAQIVALGNTVGALYSGRDELASAIDAASKECGEKFWRMPLEQSYFEDLKSSIADMKNTGTRAGGSITAALFLEKFIEDKEKTSWAHLDIAGPVWNGKTNTATGFAAGTLARWVLNH